MFGLAIEELMNILFEAAGFQVCKDLDRTLLLESFPQKYKTIWERSNQVKLELRSSTYVLDHLYKIDKVIKVGSKLYGLQLTSDPGEVTQKVIKLNKLNNLGLYNKVGISVVAVVLVDILGETDGYTFWTEEHKTSVSKQIQKLVKSLRSAEGQGYVLSSTLELP